MCYASFTRKDVPGRTALCAVVHALVHWRSSVRRVCWQSAKSTEPVSFRNLILDAMPGDFCVGANWHVQACAETESVVIGPPR